MEADVTLKITRVIPILGVVLILGISLTGYSASHSQTDKVAPVAATAFPAGTGQPTPTPATPQPVAPAVQPKPPEPVKVQPSPQELKVLALNDQVKKSGHFAGQNDGMSCAVCHISESNTKLLNTSWDSCGVCHVNESKELKVGKEVVHPQYEMIQGLPIGTVPRSPSYKYAYMKDTFSCIDCHITNSEKHDFLVPGVTVSSNASGSPKVSSKIDYAQFEKVFQQANCAVCHPDPQVNIDSVKAKQAEISQQLDQLRPVYLEWRQKVATLSADDPKVIAFNNGATFFTYVDNDGSKGAHNYNYAKVLLSKAESYWKVLAQ